MRVLPIAKTFGKIAPGRAGAELPDDRLPEPPGALVAVAPDMAGAAWKQLFNSCQLIVAQCLASQRRPPSRRLPCITLGAVTARVSRHGRPRPSGRRFSLHYGSTIVHCWSVRSM